MNSRPTLFMLLAALLVFVVACSSGTPSQPIKNPPISNPPSTNPPVQSPPATTPPTTNPPNTNPGSTPDPTPVANGVTAAQLATHNSASDCWVGYKGYAWDVTQFLPEHPGGVSAIARYCGTTAQFTQALGQKHGARMDGRLQQYTTNEGPLA